MPGDSEFSEKKLARKHVSETKLRAKSKFTLAYFAMKVVAIILFYFSPICLIDNVLYDRFNY